MNEVPGKRQRWAVSDVAAQNICLEKSRAKTKQHKNGGRGNPSLPLSRPLYNFNGSC